MAKSASTTIKNTMLMISDDQPPQVSRVVLDRLVLTREPASVPADIAKRLLQLRDDAGRLYVQRAETS